MPRKQKKYHYIYKTTNILNNKFYIGVHSTDDLDDEYVGSGKRLWYSINSHGKENHTTEILEYLDNRELLRKREEEIVNEELLEDSLCMNLTKGGRGSWEYINDSSDNHIGWCKKGREACDKILEQQWGNDWRSTLSKLGQIGNNNPTSKLKRSESLINFYKKHDGTFLGKYHTQETKRKIGIKNSISQKGKRNSQYGTCWIYSLIEKKSIKIQQERLKEYINNGWIKGRKIKF